MRKAAAPAGARRRTRGGLRTRDGGARCPKGSGGGGGAGRLRGGAACRRRRRRPFVELRTMEGLSRLNPDANPFIPASMSLFADKATEKQAESSSKGDPSGGIFDQSQNDPLALVKSVLSMFPNISEEFIDELLMANEFDINLTIDVLHELNSQNMLHDEAEMGLPTFPVTNNLDDNLGLPGGDDVSKSSSNLDQALPNDKSASTSDAKSDDRSARTSRAN